LVLFHCGDWKGMIRGKMVTVRVARGTDRKRVEELIADYHSSEKILPDRKRIAWAAGQWFGDKAPGLLLVARADHEIVGVMLAVLTPSAELGRVMTVNDFFVSPNYRRRGVGRELVKQLILKSRRMRVDDIVLEVLHANKNAARFWQAMGFRSKDRFLFGRKL